MPLKLAVIGLGRWGPNHVRNFSSLADCEVVAVADPASSARERMVAAYPGINVVADYREVLAVSGLDAVVVATPTSTHFEIVRAALQAGKHVLCEKPLTSQSEHAWDLVRLAERQGRYLVTGHVFLHNPAVRFLIKSVREGLTGPLYYLNAVRTNLGPFRSDVNAVWDLASHDVYIFNAILRDRPTSVSAVGASYLRKPIEDIAFLTLHYPGGILAHIHVSWLDPKKVRTLTMVGHTKMITWDEFGTPGPIMIYDRTVVRDPIYDTYGEFQLLTREGDVVMPRIQMHEPLAAQAKAFVRICLGETGEGEAVGVGGQGAEVVDVLEAAARSLGESGRVVEVSYGG